MVQEKIAELKQKLIVIQKELDEVKAEYAKNTGMTVEKAQEMLKTEEAKSKLVGATQTKKHVGPFLGAIGIMTGVAAGASFWAYADGVTPIFIGISLVAITVPIMMLAFQDALHQDTGKWTPQIRLYAVLTCVFIAITGAAVMFLYWTINPPTALLGFCILMIGGIAEEMAKTCIPRHRPA